VVVLISSFLLIGLGLLPCAVQLIRSICSQIDVIIESYSDRMSVCIGSSLRPLLNDQFASVLVIQMVSPAHYMPLGGAARDEEAVPLAQSLIRKTFDDGGIAVILHL
jgi:hypothetical protein